MPKTSGETKMEKMIEELQSAMSMVAVEFVSSLEKTLGRHDAQFVVILEKLDTMNASGQPPKNTTGEFNSSGCFQTPSGDNSKTDSDGDKHPEGSSEKTGKCWNSSGTSSGGETTAGIPPWMDLSMFDGTDPIAWLSQVEQYFLVHRTPVGERVQMALIAMTGRSMFWAQWVLHRSATIPWGRFMQELFERFGDSYVINAYESMHLS